MREIEMAKMTTAAKVTIESDGTAAFVLSPAGTSLAVFTSDTRTLDAVAYCEEMGMEIDWPTDMGSIDWNEEA